MHVKIVKVKDTLYLTEDHVWAIIFNKDLGQWMLFRPDEADEDAYFLFDDVRTAAQYLDSMNENN